MKLLHLCRKCLHVLRAKCADTHTCGTRATDGDVVCPDQQLPDGVRQLLMSDLHLTSQCIGKGAYRKCYVANIAHLQVCAKVFRSNDSFTNEVFMLSLCCHENLPWIYGIVVSESKILVMSLHAIDGMACSLHRFIHAEHS